MSEKLKPCPFCGGEPVIECYSNDWIVYCNNPDCDVTPDTGFRNTEEQARAVWNRRVQS